MVKRIKNVDLKNKLKGLNKTLEAGFLDNKTYPDGTPVALVATVQNFGSVANNIPPRPFMTPAIENAKEKLSKLAKFEAVKILNGESNADVLYNKAGLMLVGAIQEAIIDVTNPKLKASTQKARDRRHYSGSDSTKPLIDTGHMLASVDFRVSNET